MFGWGVKTVTVDELASMLSHGTQVLIDVREPYEFAAGHVKGAVNVPLGQLAEKLGTFDPHAETFVICQSGHRSARGAQAAQARRLRARVQRQGRHFGVAWEARALAVHSTSSAHSLRLHAGPIPSEVSDSRRYDGMTEETL